jgi:hypothetical protein
MRVTLDVEKPLLSRREDEYVSAKTALQIPV